MAAMVRVKLSISPHKTYYKYGELITYKFDIVLDKDNPAYEKGKKYIVDFPKDAAYSSTVVSSTLDSTTFLTDRHDKISATVVLKKARVGESVALSISVCRISERKHVRDWIIYNKYYYDRALGLLLTDRLNYENFTQGKENRLSSKVIEYYGEEVEMPILRKDTKNTDPLPSFPEIKPNSESQKFNKNQKRTDKDGKEEVLVNSCHMINDSYFDFPLDYNESNSLPPGALMVIK